MRRLDRYIAREIIGPLGLGFVVYTFIMLVRFFFTSAEMIIRRGVPAETVGKMLALSMPNILVLTIPMALLFGILTAIGRLSSDSELVAMRATGVSLLSLYRPILLVAGVLMVANVFLMAKVLPAGNSELQKLRIDILTQSISRQVEPRVFYAEWSGKVLYVFEMKPGDERWYGVFLAQSLPTNETDVTTAEWGTVKIDDSGERVVLELHNAISHRVDLNRPDHYSIQKLRRLDIVLEDSFTSSRREKQLARKGVRELDLGELIERVADPQTSSEQRNLARVEIHKKLSIPSACLVFGLIGLPLGFTNQRGSKSSGFALSLLVILVYYLLINNGEEAARFGRAPAWLAMWLPNALLTITGLFLLVRRNRDKSLLLSRVDRWVRQDLWRGLLHLERWSKQRRQRRREAARSGEGSRGRLRLSLPRVRLFFPNLVDRYVLRRYFGVFALVMLSFIVLYVVADLGENIDEILKHQISQGVVVSYYLYSTLQIFYDLAPIVVLVTTLITFSLLSRTNEVTALKALGVSLYRLSVPALVAAISIAAASAYLQSEVLPATNQRADELRDRIRNREPSRTFRTPDRQWLYGEGGYIYNFLHYSEERQQLQRLQVFEIGDDYSLERRLAAANASYDPELEGGEGGWELSDGWVRTFNQGRLGEWRPFAGPLLIDYPERPEFFAAEMRSPQQMRYAELRQYIEELESSGQRVPELEVELHNKIALPVASVVMALVGLPFAFRLGRRGTLYGIGLSIVLGMVFVAVVALFTALGEAGALPPLAAVWSPSAVFATLGVYLFLGVRS